MVWSLPLEIKYRPSPRLSMNVIPSTCPSRIPAAFPLDIKQRLSHTYNNISILLILRKEQISQTCNPQARTLSGLANS